MQEDEERETDLYFKHPDGSFRLAKRKEDSLALSILKLNAEREELQKTVNQMEKTTESRFSMFETLLRERLDNMKENIQLIADAAIDKQALINKACDDTIDEIKADVETIKKELHELKEAPTKKKAKRWDLIITAVGSAILAFLISYLQDILNWIKGVL